MPTLVVALAVVAVLRVPGPLSPRPASYEIRASVDQAHHRVVGHERLSWTNHTAGRADALVFHLPEAGAVIRVILEARFGACDDGFSGRAVGDLLAACRLGFSPEPVFHPAQC